MGQYYKPINLDKNQHLSSHDYNCGLKLMEHSYVGNHFVGAVENLLTPHGAWYKNRIIWAGDYADGERETIDAEHPNGFNLYYMIDSPDCKIRPEETELAERFCYLVNHTLKVFVDRSKLKPRKGEWATINPLPLLTCEGNGRGGGDFHVGDDRVGSWARHVISMEEEAPAGYEKVDGTFEEE